MTRPLGVATYAYLGAVSAPATVATRDGGATALIGGNEVWMFGDTLITSPPAPLPPSYIPGVLTNTIALAAPGDPLTTHEPLDANGVPAQAVPFTTAELAYNASPTAGASNRYALWPMSVIPDGSGGGLIFSLELIAKGALTYQPQGVSVARIGPNQTTATRVTDLLFNASEPRFGDALVDHGWVYLYGTLPGGATGIGVARAPLGSATSRAAYTFWDGVRWSSDVVYTAAVLDHAAGAVSVSFNPYLNQYLAVHTGDFLVNANQLVLQTAPTPRGPWSSPITVGLNTPYSGIDYAGLEHPELVSAGGRDVMVTYYQPTGAFTGALWLLRVTLQ
jgi:hypothetical protein